MTYDSSLLYDTKTRPCPGETIGRIFFYSSYLPILSQKLDGTGLEHRSTSLRIKTAYWMNAESSFHT